MNNQQQSSSQQVGAAISGTAGVSVDPYQHVMSNMNKDNLSYISEMIKNNKQKESKRTAGIAKNAAHSRAKSSLSNYEITQQQHLLPQQQAYQKQQQQLQLAQQEQQQQQQQQQQPQSSQQQIPKKSLSHRSLNETLPIFSRAAREEQRNELSFKQEEPLNDNDGEADEQEENTENNKSSIQHQQQDKDALNHNSNTQRSKQIKSNKSKEDQLLLAAAKQQLQQQRQQQYESDMNQSTGPSTKKSEHAQQFLTFLGNYVTYLSSNDDPVSPAGGKTTAVISLVSGKSTNDLVEENQVLQRELECLQAEFKEEQYTKKMQSIEIARLIQAHNEQKQHLETARYELWECSRRANEAITLLNKTKQLLSQEKAAHKKTHQFSTVLLEQLHNLQSQQQQQQQQSPILQQQQFQQYSSKAQRAILIPREHPNSSINMREIENKQQQQQGQQLLNSYDNQGEIDIDENIINNDNINNNNELIENGNDFSRSNEEAAAAIMLKHPSHNQFTPTHSTRRQGHQQQRQQQLLLGGENDSNEIVGQQQSQVFSSKSHQQLRNLTNLAYQHNNTNPLSNNNILSYNASPLTSILSSQGQYHPSSVLNSNSHNPPSFLNYNNNSINKSQLHNNSNNYSQYQLQLDHIDQSYLQDQPSYFQQLDQRASTSNHQEARKKYRSMHVGYNSNGNGAPSDPPSANESFIYNINDMSRNHNKNTSNNQLLQTQQQQLVNAYANSNLLNDESYYRSSRTPSKNVSLKSSGVIQSSSSAQQQQQQQAHPSQSHQSQAIPFDFFSRAQQKHH